MLRKIIPEEEILHVKELREEKRRRKIYMTSSHQNSNTKENGKKAEIAISMWNPADDPIEDDKWENLEDKLNQKKKIRIVSKYSEKRYIP